MARHLHAAIERVRADMEKVEFWADAMTSFSEPVPDYDPKDVTVWLPWEQATRLSPSAKKETPQRRSKARR